MNLKFIELFLSDFNQSSDRVHKIVVKIPNININAHCMVGVEFHADRQTDRPNEIDVTLFSFWWNSPKKIRILPTCYIYVLCLILKSTAVISLDGINQLIKLTTN
jgi:hypothetical protein